MDGRDVTTGNSLDIAEILNDLYAREISGSIAWIRDRGFRARLEKSKPVENWFHSSGDAARWLSRQALVLDPQSEFTQAPNQVASDIAIILNDLFIRTGSAARSRGFGIVDSTRRWAPRNKPMIGPSRASMMPSSG